MDRGGGRGHIWLPQLQQSRGGALSDLIAKDSEALRTEARSHQLFGAPITPDTMVVQRDPGGLTRDEQRRAVERALRIDSRDYPDLLSISFAVPILNTFGLVPSSRERSTTAVTYLYFPARYGFATRDELAHTFAGHIPPNDDLVGVTGAGPARITQYSAIRDALPIVGAATAALIALIVGLNFLSPGPALLVLVRRGPIGYLVDIRAARLGQRVERHLDPERDRAFARRAPLRDLDRLRDLLPLRTAAASPAGRGAAPAAAAWPQFTPTILVAGLTVAAGTAALLAGELDFMRAFGPGLALTAVVGVVVSVTFVPAAIALLGRALFWPSLDRRPAEAPRSSAGAARCASAPPTGRRHARLPS